MMKDLITELKEFLFKNGKQSLSSFAMSIRPVLPNQSSFACFVCVLVYSRRHLAMLVVHRRLLRLLTTKKTKTISFQMIRHLLRQR